MPFSIPHDRTRTYRVIYEDSSNPALQLTLPDAHDIGEVTEEEHLALLTIARQIGPDAIEAIQAMEAEAGGAFTRQSYREAVLTLIDWEYFDLVPLYAKRKQELLRHAMDESKRLMPTNHRFPTTRTAAAETDLGDWWPRYRLMVFQESVKGWRGLYAEDAKGQKHPIPCDANGRELVANVSDARVDFAMRWCEALANEDEARQEAERKSFRPLRAIKAGAQPELSDVS